MAKTYLFEGENFSCDFLRVCCWWGFAQQRSTQFRLLRQRFGLRGPKAYSFQPRFIQFPDTVWHIVSLRNGYHLRKS